MIRKLTLAAILIACLAPPAHSQSTFGDIRGVTRDPSGLPLPGAAVTVHSLDENNDRKVTSGDDGAFLVENLKPGHRAELEQPGHIRCAAIRPDGGIRRKPDRAGGLKGGFLECVGAVPQAGWPPRGQPQGLPLRGIG